MKDTRDAFQSYLQDIHSLDLLTREEEIDLARRAATGDQLARCKLLEALVNGNGEAMLWA